MSNWRGYWLHEGQKGPMDIDEFIIEACPNGRVLGKGKDMVGEFTFEGTFDPSNRSCTFVKQYIGQHQIFYQGTLDSTATGIEGHWGY